VIWRSCFLACSASCIRTCKLWEIGVVVGVCCCKRFDRPKNFRLHVEYVITESQKERWNLPTVFLEKTLFMLCSVVNFSTRHSVLLQRRPHGKQQVVYPFALDPDSSCRLPSFPSNGISCRQRPTLVQRSEKEGPGQ
jgi:hypothetical protein